MRILLLFSSVRKKEMIISVYFLISSIFTARHLVSKHNAVMCGTEKEIDGVKSAEWFYKSIVPDFYYGLLNMLVKQDQRITLNMVIFGGFLFMSIVTLGSVSLAASSHNAEGATSWQYFKTDLKVEGSIVAIIVGIMAIVKVVQIVLYYKKVRKYAKTNNINDEELDDMMLANEIDTMLEEERKKQEQQQQQEKESQKDDESSKEEPLSKKVKKTTQSKKQKLLQIRTTTV